MKKLFYILTILAFGFTQAQPQKVNYQAVALNAGGQTVKNQAIKLRLSILDSSTTGTVLYTETHQPTTDGAGQFSVYLGGGTVTMGAFSNILWNNGKDKFLKAEADVTGGTNYALMGTSQIVSVPYALAAGTAFETNHIKDNNGNSVEIRYDGNGNPFIALISKSILGCGQVITYFGELYPSVQIGNQCWFAKNLNVGNFITVANQQTNNSIIEKYCYNNDTLNCSKYGGLYQWAEAVQYLNGTTNTTSPNPIFSTNVKGICPTGWHIPTKIDWNNLDNYLGGSFSAKMLKATNGLWNSASDNFGFSGLPSGFYASNNFNNLVNIARFWSTFESSSFGIDIVELDNGTSYLGRGSGFNKQNGASVRCLKD